MKTINNELIRSFRPCYDPSEKDIPDSETLPVRDWVEKYRPVVPARDIVWLLCREELLCDRDLRLFAAWCAREALKLLENPDPRSVTACDVAERYAIGEATEGELQSAADDAADAPIYAAQIYSAVYASCAAATSLAANTAASFAVAAVYAANYDADAASDAARELNWSNL